MPSLQSLWMICIFGMCYAFINSPAGINICDYYLKTPATCRAFSCNLSNLFLCPKIVPKNQVWLLVKTTKMHKT